MTEAKQTPYIIKSDKVEERYARGWHVLAKADSITTRPKMFEYFGTKIVAYRGEDDGEVHVLDAYCPHMGADLSKGCVKGNSIVCPFHAWSWGADGVCDDIPYANRIPAKAVIKSWDIVEKNGLLLVWNDPEGNAPILEQDITKMKDWYSGGWTDWTMSQVIIKSHCRELVDNMADMAHFGPVHYSTVHSFNNHQKGHEFTQYMVGAHEILTEGDTPMTSIAHYEGPAYMTTTMTGMMDGQEMTTHLLVSHIPVNKEEFHINFGVMMKKNPHLSEKQNQQTVEEYTKLSIDSFIQDVEIWDNKIRIDNPLMCDGDGPINMVRKWYSQFYMDVADIPEALVKEKVHSTIDGPSVADTIASFAAKVAS